MAMRLCDDLALGVDYHGACAAGAEIEAEVERVGLHASILTNLANAVRERNAQITRLGFFINLGFFVFEALTPYQSVPGALFTLCARDGGDWRWGLGVLRPQPSRGAR